MSPERGAPKKRTFVRSKAIKIQGAAWTSVGCELCGDNNASLHAGPFHNLIKSQLQ